MSGPGCDDLEVGSASILSMSGWAGFHLESVEWGVWLRRYDACCPHPIVRVQAPDRRTKRHTDLLRRIGGVKTLRYTRLQAGGMKCLADVFTVLVSAEPGDKTTEGATGRGDVGLKKS